MNRSSAGGRNTPAGSQFRRGRSVTAMSKDTDENLVLFSKNRDSLSVASSDDTEVTSKFGRLAVGSGKVPKSGLNDFLNSTDGGKHDYDWLLTPPGTPIYPSSDVSEPHQVLRAPRSTSVTRTASTTKTSRFSVTQSESNHSSRPRSSSVTRPALSTTQHSTYSLNKSSSILNTSSASVSSYIRPSSPITRSPSITRPTTPSARPTSSRSSTPSRIRAPPASSNGDKPRPASRSSTPTSRPIIPARTVSRPSTPTRRSSAPSSSPAAASVSGSSMRGPPSISRPSSPGPRLRSPSQPLAPHDFPSDTPPNLRTSIPDRPVSAGRSRPGLSTMKVMTTENPSSGNLPKRQPSPSITRGRPEPRKTTHLPELTSKKPVSVKASTVASESTGFGRNISKKSLDMAIKHMDVKNGTFGTRPHSGTTLFPQSIRSSASKTRNGRAFSAPSSVNGNFMSENGNSNNGSPEHVIIAEKKGRISSKLTEIDIYESSRYDAILLKEDLKSTNWLHCVDDMADHGLIFDESLPEPFSPL